MVTVFVCLFFSMKKGLELDDDLPFANTYTDTSNKVFKFWI